MTNPQVLLPVTPSEVRQIDRTCDRFEAAWKAWAPTPGVGARPNPVEYLDTATGSVRRALLRQLLLLDWDYRCREGDCPRTEDYHARFPGDAAVIENVAREMAETPNSTWVGRDAIGGPDTPWIGAGRNLGGEAVGPSAESARYDLLREIGRGGIGVVFRGRDRLLGRDLAIKVLREDYRDRPDARRRFFTEARIGSRLQHPAIVPVYELGRFADGRPYITMKLVEGQTFASMLNERADPGQDLPRWLGVFEQICQAMAYAHCVGVVHRDLKPANVMVGAFGEVQVMDWGFAKQLSTAEGQLQIDDEEMPATGSVIGNSPAGSQSGALLGTPAYMSPEQARGEAALAGPPADVFALGAILCEILTGRPPYLGSAPEEICAQAAAGDLTDAHSRLDTCRADVALRDLARRCLTPDPQSRPPDAGAVAHAVTAYSASALQRLRQAQVDRAAAEARAAAERRARRLTLALAAALLVGAGIATWQAVVATRANREALAAAAAESVAKDAAAAKEAETRAALDFVENGVFAAARPKGYPGGMGREVTLRQALNAALPVIDKSFGDQPLVEARLRMTLGTSFMFLGEPKTAAALFGRARAIYTEHLGPDHPDTLKAMTNLANSYDDLGRRADALALREETLARQKISLGADHPDTLKGMNNVARSYFTAGRTADALKLLTEILERRKTLLGPDHPDTLRSINNLAMCYAALGRDSDALNLRAQTLALQKAKLGPDDPDTLQSMNNLATSYAAAGRHADALNLFSETLARRKAALGPDHPDTLQSMNNLAMAYAEAGRRADALALREETLSRQRVKLGPDHPATLRSLNNVASSYFDLGRCADSLQLYKETLALQKIKLGPDHPDTLNSMWGVAANLTKLGRDSEALPILDECLQRAVGKSVHRSIVAVADLRLRHFEKANDAAGCRATAEMLEKLQRTDAGSLYEAAACRAVLAKVVRATDSSPAGIEEFAAQANRAMGWLRQAVRVGYHDTQRLQNDPDLAVLNGRDDFTALLWDLADASPQHAP